jgi:serine/threonine-protein kinase RsbW
MAKSHRSSKTAADQTGSAPDISGSSSPIPFEGSQKTRLFTARFEYLDEAREFVADAAETSGLDEAAVYAAQLAVDEAFTNIVEHAYGGESLEKIECTCLMSDRGLVIQLKDCGKPFDPSLVPVPDLEAELEERDIGGLGLFFIQQLMDEVEFTFTHDPETGKQCNVLRMVKRKEG